MAALIRLIGPELKSICLIHLSEKNNHESIVRAMADETIHESGATLHLRIARQDVPGEIIEIGHAGGPRPPAAPCQLSLF